ncbi:stathmin domain-containing protein 1 [Sceloporus undulatus]|uniref:stathmin domain-containing protein 1 n=1 Tax=Sceloporus undulatus TaxID=8520 RepID=UPI001C4BE178|nr:stathmin domain-containing protein 1 [Sceloporus undulatus]
MKNRRQSCLFCFQTGSCCTMGCNTSSGVTVEEASPKNPPPGREVPTQAEKDASLESISISSSGSINEDGSCQGKLQEKHLEQGNTKQNTDSGVGLPRKPVGLLEKERQTSSDILEELQIQGIIKSSRATSKNGTADDTMLVHTGRPPAKLEKLEINKGRKQIIKL